MTREAVRGCGFRRVGGLYLVGSGYSVPCDRLPVPVEPCGACGFEPSQTRSYAWVSGQWLGDHRLPVGDSDGVHGLLGRQCPDAKVRADLSRIAGRDVRGSDPICMASPALRLLMWVGARFYTPETFTEESRRLGVSKRVSELPIGLELGRTWVLLAHPAACFDALTWGLRWLFGDGEVLPAPGVFHAFKPRAAELVLHESEVTPERAAREAGRGVSVVIVPDGAADARVSWRPGEPRPPEASVAVQTTLPLEDDA